MMNVNDNPDPTDKSPRKADDDTSCPLCGHEDIWEPCEHLVADWSADPYDNDGGVLGGGFTDNAAFVGARDLALAVRDLHNLVRDEADESASRLVELRRMMSEGEHPPWWPELDDHFESDGLGVNDDATALAYDADPVVEAIVQQVPDLRLTWVEMGAPMMNGIVHCLWAEDRAAAIAKVKERIAAETETVRALIAKLKDYPGSET